MHMLLHKKAG